VYTLYSKNASGLVTYSFPLSDDKTQIVYAASDDVLVSGSMTAYSGALWTAYVTGVPNQPISSTFIGQQSFMIDYQPVVKGTTIFLYTRACC
jgi:hypothetical protein